MGLFSLDATTGMNESFSDDLVNDLVESFLYDDVLRLPDDLREAYLEENAQVLEEAGKFKKNTIVKLSRTDDLSRRIKMACLQIARDKSDPLFDMLLKNRVKERKLIGKIKGKYLSPATRLAKVSQKEYIKNVRRPAVSLMKR